MSKVTCYKCDGDGCDNTAKSFSQMCEQDWDLVMTQTSEYKHEHYCPACAALMKREESE